MTKKIMSGFVILVSLLITNAVFAQDQKSIDDKLLHEYFAKNHIQPIKTPSGLYYSISKQGVGEFPKVGKNVVMNYIGKTLDGKIFDANVDENFHTLPGKQPLTFPIGVGRVIKGWDEGVLLLQKGTKGTFYIPSGLAYGPSAMGNAIPANSVLIFDVELVSFEN